MAKAPTSKPARPPRATPTAAAAPLPAGEVDDGDTIRMLTGQEGPGLSRVRGQQLLIGTDLDVAEARRLVDVDFAERA